MFDVITKQYDEMMTVGLRQLLEDMSNTGAQGLSVTTSVHIGRIHVGIINIGIGTLRELVGIANG